jgi:hypothetical protein
VSAVLWDDVPPENEFPQRQPLLAHYTSIASLESIVKNDEMWFSNPLYMNDWEELQYGMNAGAAEFRRHQGLVEACGDASTHANLVSHFDKLFHEFDIDHAIDTYVLCFSEHAAADNDGLLSMWRGYGASGSGVALVFDSAKINAREQTPLVLRKVIYATQADRMAWVGKKLVALAGVLRAIDKTDENLYYTAAAWIERLKMFALFTKHSGFSEENEWRIVYFSERDKNQALSGMLSYVVSPRGVQPKLKLRLMHVPGVIADDMSLEKVVDRIILGPSISTVLASSSVRRMLQLTGKRQLADRVVSSSIPFRP